MERKQYISKHSAAQSTLSKLCRLARAIHLQAGDNLSQNGAVEFTFQQGMEHSLGKYKPAIGSLLFLWRKEIEEPAQYWQRHMIGQHVDPKIEWEQ